MRKLSLLAFVLGLGLAACRSSGGDDSPGQDSTVTPDDVKIQDIQNDAMTSGTPVKLKGVVVTAKDLYGAKTGDIWVQEPEGGEYSGIHVYTGTDIDQVSGLDVGAVVDIEGVEKDEFQYSEFDPGYGITELKPISGGHMKVTPTGEMMTLQPHVVDAVAIGQLGGFMQRDPEWEKWEGVLITVQNVSAQADQECVGSDCNDPMLQKLEITGGAVVESSLAPFPADYMDAEALKRGDCLGSVTGVLDYFFDYQILPRSTDEIVTGGTSCPVENTDELCGDGIDNDGNGFADCDDFDCQDAVASCVSSVTIEDIQTGGLTGNVQFDAYIISLDKNQKHLWVADSTTAAINQGIYIYRGTSETALDGTYVPGAKVHISGVINENNNDANGDTVTQIKGTTQTPVTVTVTDPPADDPTPLTVADPATLADPTTGEPYESVYVTLTNVEIS
jgi:hypothetical protein